MTGAFTRMACDVTKGLQVAAFVGLEERDNDVTARAPAG